MSKILPSDPSYGEFTSGATDHVAPLSAIDKKMINFAIRTANQPAVDTHGQILRNFGMLPPQFWTRIQDLAWHPELHTRTKNRLTATFPILSTPGPMKGGAPMYDGFTHGVMW